MLDKMFFTHFFSETKEEKEFTTRWKGFMENVFNSTFKEDENDKYEKNNYKLIEYYLVFCLYIIKRNREIKEIKEEYSDNFKKGTIKEEYKKRMEIIIENSEVLENLQDFIDGEKFLITKSDRDYLAKKIRFFKTEKGEYGNEYSKSILLNGETQYDTETKKNKFFKFIEKTLNEFDILKNNKGEIDEEKFDINSLSKYFALIISSSFYDKFYETVLIPFCSGYCDFKKNFYKDENLTYIKFFREKMNNELKDGIDFDFLIELTLKQNIFKGSNKACRVYSIHLPKYSKWEENYRELLQASFRKRIAYFCVFLFVSTLIFSLFYKTTAFTADLLISSIKYTFNNTVEFSANLFKH